MDCTACCQPGGDKDIVISRGEPAPGFAVEGLSETDPGLNNGYVAPPAAVQEVSKKSQEASYADKPVYEEKKETKVSGDVAFTAPKKREIAVNVTKKVGQGEKGELGLDVDYGDRLTLLVVKVKEGIVNEWNKEMKDKGQEVSVGDRIIAANEQGGSTDKIIYEVQRKDNLNLTVQKNKEIQFCVEKESADASHGIDITGEGVVLGVQDGPFQKYNSQLDTSLQEFALKGNDKIIEVNKRRSSGEILKELKNSKVLDIVMYRASAS